MTIWDLELHESLTIEGTGGADVARVIRVPGGWIYYYMTEGWNDVGYSVSNSTIFVPFVERAGE